MKFNNIEDWCKEVDKLPRRFFFMEKKLDGWQKYYSKKMVLTVMSIF